MNDLRVLNDSESSFNASVFEDILILSSKGEGQFQEFWTQKLP